MEDLTSLMQSIDLVSKSIPEGEYLKMCHNMKNLYKVVPRPTSPEVALPRVRTHVPFPESDSEEEQNNDLDRITEPLIQHAHAIGQATERKSSQVSQNKTESYRRCEKGCGEGASTTTWY
jgi:hypothetical protein